MHPGVGSRALTTFMSPPPLSSPRRRRRRWDSCDVPDAPLEAYDALRDPALQAFFNKPRAHRHLMYQGFVTDDGIIVPDVRGKNKIVDDAFAVLARHDADRVETVHKALTARLVQTRKLEAELALRRRWVQHYARGRSRRAQHAAWARAQQPPPAGGAASAAIAVGADDGSVGGAGGGGATAAASLRARQLRHDELARLAAAEAAVARLPSPRARASARRDARAAAADTALTADGLHKAQQAGSPRVPAPPPAPSRPATAGPQRPPRPLSAR